MTCMMTDRTDDTIVHGLVVACKIHVLLQKCSSGSGNNSKLAAVGLVKPVQSLSDGLQTPVHACWGWLRNCPGLLENTAWYKQPEFLVADCAASKQNMVTPGRLSTQFLTVDGL